jgi:hypothetical protein
MSKGTETPTITVAFSATTTLSYGLYRDRRAQGEIEVWFSPYFADASKNSGIPEWKVREEADRAAIAFVSELTGMPADQLTISTYRCVGAIIVLPKSGFAFPASTEVKEDQEGGQG